MQRTFASAVDAPTQPSAVHEQQQQPKEEEVQHFRAHIDFKFVRDNLDTVIRNCQHRQATADPAEVVKLYEEYIRIQQETETLRAARNENSSAMKVSGSLLTL